MKANNSRLLQVFSILHWLGLMMFAYGLYLLMSQNSEDVQSIVLVSTLIALGLLIMAPYPIVLFFRWAQRDKK